MLTLGEWFAFREADHVAADYLERARAAGATAPALLLGRCYWRLGRFNEARKEFQQTLKAGGPPAEYLRQCIEAVSRQGAPDLRQIDALNHEAWKLRRDGRLKGAESLRREVAE